MKDISDKTLIKVFYGLIALLVLNFAAMTYKTGFIDGFMFTMHGIGVVCFGWIVMMLNTGIQIEKEEMK